MMRLIVLGILAGTALWVPVAQAEDDFGSSYFTAETPAALKDGTTDFWADSVSTIEPAAGDSSTLFILPTDQSAVVETPDPDRLSVPAEPLVPGMEQIEE